ncbi:MAG: Sensor protein RstB [Planctomycetota bacterium]|jgi:signal transduction histidine kinase
MKRLFLKIAGVSLLMLVVSRWLFFFVMDQQFFSDRERIVAGLATLQLGSLRLAAAELRREQPGDRELRLREWNASLVSPIRIISRSTLSEADRRKLDAVDGFAAEYRCGILDRVTVGMDADNCLQLGPIADRIRRFVEEEVGGVLQLLLSRMADQRLTAGELQKVSQTLGVPVALRQRGDFPQVAQISISDTGNVMLFHEGRESFVVAPVSGSDQVLCAGPLVRVRARAELLSIGMMLIAAMFFAGANGFVVTLLSQRFRRIEKAAVAMAGGDFSARVNERDAGEAGSLAAAFNRMAATTENAIHYRRDLLQIISHELRTPVARLRFAVEMLDEPENGAADSRIAVIRHSLDDLEKITLEALEYVQSDGRSMQLTLEWIDVRELISRLLETIAVECPGLTTRFCGAAGEKPERVFADPGGFYRVMVNLIGNAQRFAKSELTVSVVEVGPSDRGPGGTRVIVEDDGPGIPEDRRTAVLQPFVREHAPAVRPQPSDSGVRDRHPHVGLGLAIAQGILTQHQGRLEIQASRQGGCRIETWWPNPAG